MKVKISVTMSRTLSLADIKKEYGDRLELEKDDDPTEKLVEYINDNGLDFFDEEDSSEWEHNVEAVPVK